MKNKKGFISISIIYSFFIVFLLILVLIMTTYMNNRYSFNIYTKDIKRDHANKSQAINNNDNSISYETNGKQFGGYYYSTTKNDLTNYVNYFYYSSGLTTSSSVGNYGINQEVKGEAYYLYIYLGNTEEHKLNNTTFFKEDSTHTKVLKEIPNDLDYHKILIFPALNNRYVNWNAAMQDAEGFDDINNKLINSIGTQLFNIGVGETFKDKCKNTSGCSINIILIGYEDGADGVIRYMSYSSDDSKYTNTKFYMINSGTICNTTKCDLTSEVEVPNFKKRVTTSGIATGYGKENTTDLTKNYYGRMTDLKAEINAPNYTVNKLTVNPEIQIANIIKN